MGVESSSTKARVRPKEDYVPDIAVQYREQIKARRAQTSAAAQVRDITTKLTEPFSVVEFEAEKAALRKQAIKGMKLYGKNADGTKKIPTREQLFAVERQVRDSMLGSAEKRTGIAHVWVDPQDKVHEIYQRFQGKVDSSAAPVRHTSSALPMPKPVYESIARVAPVIMAAGGDATVATKWFKDFARVMQVPGDYFRLGATKLQPMFAARNLAGSLSLAYAAHGIEGLARLPDSIATAVYATLKNTIPEVAFLGKRKILVGGRVSTIGEAAEHYRKWGAFKQQELAMASVDVSGSTLGDAFEGYKTLGDKMTGWPLPYLPTGKGRLRALSMGMQATLSENIQRASVLTPFVQGFDDISMAKAMKHVSDFGGDYSRMSPAMKLVNNIIPFSAWQSFLMRMITNTFLKNPERLGRIAKMVDGVKNTYQSTAPYGPNGVPDYLYSSAPAPLAFQPLSVRKVA